MRISVKFNSSLIKIFKAKRMVIFQNFISPSLTIKYFFPFLSHNKPINRYFSLFFIYLSTHHKTLIALVIKPSNIRIWIHDKDIDKLMKVVLEGHGQKLRNEVASSAKVKRFLEYVPHFMGLIKTIHSAVIENNIELLRAKTSPPVPPQMLNCKDINGLTPLHKAAGLGHTKIVEYLIESWPHLLHETDSNGKSALHYAAGAKNNDRTYSFLLEAGADELTMDGVG